MVHFSTNISQLSILLIPTFDTDCIQRMCRISKSAFFMNLKSAVLYRTNVHKVTFIINYIPINFLRYWNQRFWRILS